MTPDEAVAHLVKSGVIKWAHGRDAVRPVVEAVATTAKADETRRCAARARSYTTLQWGNTIADDLLHTGGLKV